ncbi:hypothetical protein [Streptomyces sp. NPDC021096]|uniref:hypothetical protein n=1 Tax=Streptomyces sp. NPDC021096 TaxID=3154792 RepID=UPI00340168CF
MTHTSRTTSGRKAHGDWLGVTLGWIWALGTIAAAGGLAAIVHTDQHHPGHVPIALSLPDSEVPSTSGGW